MVGSMKAVAVALVGLAVAAPAAGFASESVSLGYDIRKEGESIGKEQVRIAREDDGATSVEVKTHTRAKVLFLEFTYDHSRHEEWRGGRLVHMVGDTDDDGSKYHLEATRSNAGWTLVVNGQSSERAGDLLPLTLWGRSILDKGELFSIIDAKPYKVQVASLGNEDVPVGDKTVAAEHFRMTGDVQRDLWYGADGYLLRVTFTRSGYPIEIVREDRRS